MSSGSSRLSVRVGYGIAGALFGGAALLTARRFYGDRVIRRRFRALTPEPTSERFEPRLVEGLPEPVQRYFLHALAVGARIDAAARFSVRGEMRLSKDDAFRLLRAEALIAPPRGFVWKASVGEGRSRFDGYDWLEGDDAGVEFYAVHALPVAHRRGLDVRRSAAGRLAAESILAPASLLPSRGVRWEVEGPDTVRATLRIAGEPHSVTIVLDASGRVLRASLLRWGDLTADKCSAWIPFGVDVDEERTFEGITAPSVVRVAWWYGTAQHFEFYRAELEAKPLDAP